MSFDSIHTQDMFNTICNCRTRKKKCKIFQFYSTQDKTMTFIICFLYITKNNNNNNSTNNTQHINN